MNLYRTFRDLSRTMGVRSAIRQMFRDFHTARPGYLAQVTWTDKALSWLFLPLIPSFIIPNYLTLFRFSTIPILLILILSGNMLYASILFLVSAFSDALDGALARTRNQITEWGIVNDPIADKMLIGTVVALLVTKYINLWFALAIIVVEMIIGFSALYQAQKLKQKIIPAKWVGKIKMILESVGLMVLFVHIFTLSPIAFWLSVILLSLGLLFAILSLIVYKSI
jgi:CDP-diacylglycerol--glycerol-3-phosphate 3-phosphatidyltransferase